MIDLSTVREAVREIDTIPDTGGFLTVSDWSSATDAIEFGDAQPPAAYVSLSREQPDKNRYAAGGRAQRVRSTISILFVLGAERADGERTDPVEVTRGSIIKRLAGFTPGGAIGPFDYAGYQLRAEGNGQVWGEVLMETSWDLRGPT